MEQRVYAVMRQKEDRHWWFRGRRAVIEALLGRVGGSGERTILDVGCGTGRNMEMYRAHGDVFGVDPSPEAVEFCRDRGIEDVRVGDAVDLPYEAGEFGLLTATDVIEHVEDDGAALREMHRVAAADARLLLTVPAYRWMWSDEDERLGHYRRYSRDELVDRAREAGWEPHFCTHFNTILLPPIALARRLPSCGGESTELERTPAALDSLLSMPMRLEAKLVARGLSLPAGVSLGLVCRRA